MKGLSQTFESTPGLCYVILHDSDVVFVSAARSNGQCGPLVLVCLREADCHRYGSVVGVRCCLLPNAA